MGRCLGNEGDDRHDLLGTRMAEPIELAPMVRSPPNSEGDATVEAS